MLYQRHNYLNKNISYLVANEIIEYDIKSAGFNIYKKFNLVDDYKIKKLEKMNRAERQMQIGWYKKFDKTLSKKENEKLVEVRKWFFEQNGLTDEDIISIKKDAILTTKRCLITEWDNINFVEKNVYTSYYYLNNFEFYYNKDVIHVKGIKDDKLELHKDYMIDFLHTFFKMQEISKRKKIIEFIKEFSFYYRLKKLDIGYYRELNSQSLYRLHDSLYDEPIGIEFIGDVNKIDIGYNFIKYVVPLISLLI